MDWYLPQQAGGQDVSLVMAVELRAERGLMDRYVARDGAALK